MLEACQTEWAELRRAGVPPSEALFSFSAPQRAAGGAQPAYFRREAFFHFDPVPYLDSRNRATYSRPLELGRGGRAR